MSADEIAGLLVGLGVASTISRWVTAQINQMQSGVSLSTKLRILILIIGTTTGYEAVRMAIDDALVFVLISILFCIQFPIDLLTHQLLRIPTVLILIGIVMTHSLEMFFADRLMEHLSTIVLAALLSLGFLSVHLVSRSSLGRGDVLLSAPIAIALSPFGPTHLAWWILIAAATCCIHALMLVRSKPRHLPFGPHLLFGAWLMLLISV